MSRGHRTAADAFRFMWACGLVLGGDQVTFACRDVCEGGCGSSCICNVFVCESIM